MSVTSTITTYVRYCHPGIMASETSIREVGSRDPQRAAADAPASAFGFTFFDRASATVTVQGDEVGLGSSDLRESGTYYIDGERLTEADLVAMGDHYSTLLANLRGNGWPAVVRCRSGNFQPLMDGDQIVSAS